MSFGALILRGTTFRVPYGVKSPPLDDFSVPAWLKNVRALKFGVRAVDLAGNRSAPNEIALTIP